MDLEAQEQFRLTISFRIYCCLKVMGFALNGLGNVGSSQTLDSKLSANNKVDGLTPLITNPPQTSSTALSFFMTNKLRQQQKWHVTHDTWYLTYRPGVMNIVSIFQFPSCNGFGAMVFWKYYHKRWLSDWINQSINDDNPGVLFFADFFWVISTA